MFLFEMPVSFYDAWRLFDWLLTRLHKQLQVSFDKKFHGRLDLAQFIDD